MTAKLRISADDQEGVLQRVIFEFSRRNISIEKLIFVREGGSNAISVELKNDADAMKVVKSIKKIQGVAYAEQQLDGCEAHASATQTRREVNPQEMLG
ncbi:MAG: hypothetical protein KIY11_00045 [Thermoplasmata archaeon]|nr:hypothetical protein [Candidatus Sysuiplasma acidicola]